MKIAELAFKLTREPVPEEAVAAWGARAIYNGQVDLVWDRQDLKADDDELKEKLKRKLNGGALAAFMNWAEDRFFGHHDDVQSFTNRGVRFWASTNASYGYLYVTATLET
jgi:hypothetical protein